ncbi:MAG: class I SAM-dependent RNA methyltransferase, partial [Pseudoflavonifractor sp.]
WLEAADEAIEKEYDGEYDIWGGDTDPQAVAIAKSNARLAGVDDLVRFEVADATQFHRDAPHGRIVTNPPYGERIMERDEAERLYTAFGQAFFALPERWELYLLSSHTEFERTFGRTADKKRKLYNGMIKCDMFQYNRT